MQPNTLNYSSRLTEPRHQHDWIGCSTKTIGKYCVQRKDIILAGSASKQIPSHQVTALISSPESVDAAGHEKTTGRF